MFKQLQVALTGTIAVLAAMSALATGAAAMPTASASHHSKPHSKPPISAGAALVLPSQSQCVKDGQLTVQLRKISHVSWTSVVVKVNGRRLTTISPTQVNRPVQISGLPTGSITLSITAQTRDHRSITATRHFHSCATKPPKPPEPPKITPPTSPTPQPDPTPTPPAPSTAPQAGLYRTFSNQALFYVSADHAHVQDVTRSTSLSCSTGGGISSSIAIEDIPIEADGSFKTTQVENTIISGKPVTITITFSGNFHGTEANGTYREDVEYKDGSGKTCTTGTESWPASIDSGQGSQLLAPPQAGLYRTFSNQALFYVSADHAHVQDVTRSTSLSCDSGASPSSSISITDIPIEGESTFRKTQVESGLVSGKPAKITITFNGHFHGFDGSGNQRAAGTYREDVELEDGSGVKCTTGTQSWPAGWSSS